MVPTWKDMKSPGLWRCNGDLPASCTAITARGRGGGMCLCSNQEKVQCDCTHEGFCHMKQPCCSEALITVPVLQYPC